VLLLAFIGASACERKTPAAAPPPSAGLPPLEETPHAGTPEALTHAPHAGGEGAAPALPPGHPPVAATDEQTTPGDVPFDPHAVISGVLQVDAHLREKVKAGETIFLVARNADGPPGPPLAVKRLQVGQWPLAFELDARDAMVPGTKLAGKVVLSARADQDGDASSKVPGDVVGTSAPIVPPQRNVVITLDKVL
jgi:hypothetical protein